MRKRNFQRLHIQLECGCTPYYHTCWYRLSKVRQSLIFNHFVRRGFWCFTHGGPCQPTAILGTSPEPSVT